MQSIAEFFAMGGHAGYIWPSFAIALLALLVLLIASVSGWRQSELVLRTLRQERRRPQPQARPVQGSDEGL